MLNYAPDLDPRTPDVLVAQDSSGNVNTHGFVPTLRGYRVPMLASPLFASAPFSTTRQKWEYGIHELDYSTGMAGRHIIYMNNGSATAKAWEVSAAGTYTDISLGAGYSGAGSARASFVQYGIKTLLATGTGTIKIQQSTAVNSAFTEIATAPRANIIVRANDFVMALNYVDGTYGTNPDGWWGCALGDPTSWTPDAATQAANGKLTDTPGPITAAVFWNNYIVAFKGSSCYIGQYVGSPVIWSWQLLSGTAGCVAGGAVVTPDGVYFYSGKDFFRWRGGPTVESIGAPLRIFAYPLYVAAQFDTYSTLYDRVNGVVYWVSPGTSANTTVFCFHTTAEKWSPLSISEAAFNTSISGTYHTNLFGSAYESVYTNQFIFPQPGGVGPLLMTYVPPTAFASGAPYPAVWNTGFVGDAKRKTKVQRVQLEFVTDPSQACSLSMYPTYQSTLGVVGANSGTTTTPDTTWRYNYLQSARYHSFRFTYVPVGAAGEYAPELVNIGYTTVDGGAE